MSNLTITIDDDLLRAARVKAVQLGTSVNEVCRLAIAAFALEDKTQAQARAHARAQAFLDFNNNLMLTPRSRAGQRRSVKLSRDAVVEEMLSAKSSLGAKR